MAPLQLFRTTPVLPLADYSATVMNKWVKRSLLRRTDAHIHDFEEETWNAQFRLAATPFRHHVAMMVLLRGRIASQAQLALNPASSLEELK